MHLMRKIALVICIIIGFALGNSCGNQLKLMYKDVKQLTSNVQVIANKVEQLDQKVGALQNTYQEEHLKPTYDYLKSVTVVIKGKGVEMDPDTEEMVEVGWMGTGIIIKENLLGTFILTNKHVAPLISKANIYVEDGSPDKLINAKVLANDSKMDLSLIYVPYKFKGKTAIKGLATNIKEGDKVFLVGHHLGRRYTYGEGVFAGRDDCVTEKDTVLYHIQVPICSGNSGSGVFNQAGELVGLVFAQNLEAIGPFSVMIDVAHGLVVPVMDVARFLLKNGLNV